jgi:hypothetical protein
MKALFRVSLIVAILLPVSWFGFVFFMYGGCIIPIVTPLMSYICFIVFLLSVVLSPFFLLGNIVAAIFLWKRGGLKLFLPIVLIIVAFLIFLPLRQLAHSFCDKRFERHLPQYEQAVAEIEKDSASKARFARPRGWRHLSVFPPITYREDDGTLTVEFLVGGIGPPARHVSYIYRSNGTIEKGSISAQKWHGPIQLNEHWFRASY